MNCDRFVVGSDIRVPGFLALAAVMLLYALGLCIAYIVLYVSQPSVSPAFLPDIPFFQEEMPVLVFTLVSALVSLTILVCVSFLLAHFRKNGPEEMIPGVRRQVAIACLIVVGSLMRCIIGFYSSYGGYETPDFVVFVFGVALADVILFCAILAFIGMIWFSSRRVITVRRKIDNDTPLLASSEEATERETPAMYQI